VPAGEQRVLSQRALNRAVLARQSLLERSALPMPELLERVGGLQAQYAPSMYVGLWSRSAGFERDALTRALEDRSVVQGTLLRSTIHLVSPTDYWPMALGTRSARQATFLRAASGRPPPEELVAAAERLRHALRAGPLTRADLDRVVGKGAREGVSAWLEMVRVPPSGTWQRRRADLYALAEDWLGRPGCTEQDGLELLVRRRLGGFGPATAREIANWAGVPVTPLRPVLDRLGLRRFRADDGAQLLDLPDLPLPDEKIPVPARYLPTWDATLLVHCRRAAILPEEHRPAVFSIRNPHSVSTFLVDGAVAGCWRYEKGRIGRTEFVRVPRAARRELDEEAERLAAFHA
jgi:DNA glycosylase AlkZ-like